MGSCTFDRLENLSEKCVNLDQHKCSLLGTIGVIGGITPVMF